MNKPIQKLLSQLGWLFGSIVKARRRLYQKNIFKSDDLGVPVISVGNLTVGGTGKTPLVAYVAKVLAEKGHKVCILTRGYKRENPNERVLVSDGEKLLADAKQAGDEPFELANKLLGFASVIADKRRAEAGKWARENWGVTAFVLDDGFQHWQVKRDLDIVTIDATNPFGNGELLPAGILREPLSALKRANCAVITRANLTGNISNLKSQISEINADCVVLISQTEIVGLLDVKEFRAKTQRTQSGKQRTKDKGQRANALAFCALGNPDNFFESLKREGFNLSATKVFSDHYAYAQKDVEEIEKTARQVGAETLLTTAKDAVKLKDLQFSLPCLVVEIEVFFDDDAPLRALLNAL